MEKPKEIDPTSGGVRREMVRAFLDCGPEQLTAFESAVAQKRGERIAWAAHSLRGSVSFFRKGEIVELLATIEQAGKREDVQVAMASGPRIRDDVHELLRELQAEAEGFTD
jgi:HPt (histidine-containing phosphotransfer) domain-containing protein